MQKDFNRQIGLGIFIVAAVVSLIIAGLWSFVWAFVFMVVVTLLDVLLYQLLPEITVCYACKAFYRDAKRNPEHGAFDLHLLERYEKKDEQGSG